MITRRALKTLSDLDRAAIANATGDFAVVLGAYSAESRCLRIPEITKDANCLKIAFYAGVVPGAEHDKIGRRLVRYGFELCDYDEGVLKQKLNAILGSRKSGDSSQTLSILVDATSLPRRLLASIMALLLTQLEPFEIDLSIGYTLARYTPPSRGALAHNKRVAPVHPLLAGWTSRPGLPVAALVGLGYERGKALGAVEYLQASESFLFIPDSPETKFKPKVEIHNRNLIKAVRADRVFEYQVLAPAQTFLTLAAMIAGIKSEAKPVLLPFGPKIFFAVSVLVAMFHPEAAVWSVSGEELEPALDRQPSAHTTGFRCSLQKL